MRDGIKGLSLSGLIEAPQISDSKQKTDCRFGRCYGKDPASADEITRQQESESQQKIFNAQWNGKDFAYVVMGTISSKGKTFDLLAEARDSIRSLSKERVNDYSEYIHRFAARIHVAFERAKREGRLKTYGGNPLSSSEEARKTVAQIFILGYFRKHDPTLATLTFVHENQIMPVPHVTLDTPPRHDTFVGSSTIAKLLFQGNDPRFSKYVIPKSVTDRLDVAAEHGIGFIRACSDPMAVAIDPVCAGIGGHIHVAEITPEGGFRWRIPPL
jgi:hypothetical protein